ncbi:hypothetical protein AB0C02_27885 [Micromonospora sp. NPDC048999]|uniref:hypothetical protein n=1 Tax=Micromonospora sp. NPDC048999 TaxID=3155391 RepID=UPI0033FF5EBD
MTAAERKARAEALREAIAAMAMRNQDAALRFGLAKLGSEEETRYYRAMRRRYSAVVWLARALARVAGGAR